MQSAQVYLEVVRHRGERRLELRKVYRHLKNQEFFLQAYAKLYANAGALTPGADPQDTVDAMSLKRIGDIVRTLEKGTYQWKPVRRIYIPKKNGQQRPLGIPSWSDKLLQEVLRIVLSAYYEPQFSPASHGFRPGHGCHTALQDILSGWKGTKWFIEGDIRGCFDNISHNKLLAIISRNIKDERLMKLLKGMLDAGYLEDWTYYPTYSGVPQGGVLSPLLTNIFLNELDMYIEQTLLPPYTKGEDRHVNPEYARITQNLHNAKKAGDVECYRELKKRQQSLPSKMTDDPNYRRLHYCRYADDFLLGFVGPRHEAEDIKHKIGEFLQTLGLTLSEEKTLITHATDEHARFLGYEVSMAQEDTCKRRKQRSVNGCPVLQVPHQTAKTWQTRYTRKGKPQHRTELLQRSDHDIVVTFDVELQGLVNYYTLAHDVAVKLYPVKWAYQQSLVKTLAYKHQQSVAWVYRKYKRKTEEGVTAIVVETPREGKKPLIAKFGAKPICFDKRAVVTDLKAVLWPSRNELVKRLQANQCELCGSTEDIQVHHIHKLKDIQQRYQGRPNPPTWAIRLMELRRKTLVVCSKCHHQIHAGVYDGPKLN